MRGLGSQLLIPQALVLPPISLQNLVLVKIEANWAFFG